LEIIDSKVRGWEGGVLLVPRKLFEDGFPSSSGSNISVMIDPWFQIYTPPKFNIAPEKCWLED